jgi:hypothetical protein
MDGKVMTMDRKHAWTRRRIDSRSLVLFLPALFPLVLAPASAARANAAAGSTTQQGTVRFVIPRVPGRGDSAALAAAGMGELSGGFGRSGSISGGAREVYLTGGHSGFYSPGRRSDEVGWSGSLQMLWWFENGVSLGWRSGYHRIDRDVRVIPAVFELLLPLFSPDAPVNPFFSLQSGLCIATGRREFSPSSPVQSDTPPNARRTSRSEWNGGGLLIGFGGGARIPVGGGLRLTLGATVYVGGSPGFYTVEAGFGFRP